MPSPNRFSRYRSLCLEELDARRVLAALASEGEIGFPHEINVDWDQPVSEEGIDLEALCGQAGRYVTPLGDINGDQLNDFFLRVGSGGRILLGRDGPWPADACSDEEAIRFIYTGSTFHPTIGDVDLNADGFNDLIVTLGVRQDNQTHYTWFAVFGSDNLPSTINLDQPQPGMVTTIILDPGYRHLGFGRLPDISGDGNDDLLITLVPPSFGDPYRYLVLQSEAWQQQADLAIPTGNPDVEQYFAASSEIPITYRFRPIGDVNGDGFNDFGSGGAYYHPRYVDRAIYVRFGDESQTVPNFESSLFDGRDGFRIVGSQHNLSRHGVDRLGDINGDGIDDFVVESNCDGYCNLDQARSSVVFGRAGSEVAELDIDAAPANVSFSIQGVEQGEYAEYLLSPAGDVNGDGFDDILVVGNFDPSVRYNFANVLLGVSHGYPKVIERQGSTLPFVNFHGYVAVGDVNNDGYDDIGDGTRIIFGRDIPLPDAPVPVSWTNAANRYDVDSNGNTTIGDAYMIVSSLRRDGSRQLPLLYEPSVPSAYLDVNGDGRATISDALEIILAIKLRSPTGKLELATSDTLTKKTSSANGNLFDEIVEETSASLTDAIIAEYVGR